MSDSGISSLLKVWFIGCGLMMIVSAPVAGFFLWRMFEEGRASAHWPSVEGKVMRAEVIETNLGFEQRFHTRVEYEYSVHGERYVGTRIGTSAGEWKQRAPAEQEIDDFTPGRPTRVYYNPADPSKSLLRPGAQFRDYAMLGIPLIMVAFGVGSFVVCFFRGD